jgi:hypothetical protein
MRWSERQAKIEEKTYEIIDDIAEEIGVKVPYLPEVYWVGRKLKFESLGLNKIDEETFDIIKQKRNSAYLVRSKIILIGTQNKEHVSEETGHFLHYNTSNIKWGWNNHDNKNTMALNSIVEMFGFFCSKLIVPKRKHNYGKLPDYFDENKKFIKEAPKNLDIFEFAVHQQGYGLGEKLFNSYISDVVQMKNIKKLFLNDFSKKNSAFASFLGLKYNMVDFLNK